MSDPFKSIDSLANQADKIKKYEDYISTSVAGKSIPDLKKLVDHGNLPINLFCVSFGRASPNHYFKASDIFLGYTIGKTQ